MQPGSKSSMITNWPLASRRNALWQRARIVREIREFFSRRDYLEIETPYRIPAPPPESHIEAVPCGTWFLHTSPEICMKRMLAAGYEKLFQICRCWREGERGSRHTPEFTLLEWYRAGDDYEALMEECEALIQAVSNVLCRGTGIRFRDQEIDLVSPWERMTVAEAFQCHAGISMKEALERDLFDETMVQEIEPRLGGRRPTFIYDYPAGRAAMARLKPGDPTVAERFELYMGGLEIANAFSELTDPEEQRRRFDLEASIRRSLGKTVYPTPDKFLSEMESMPPAAGAALGVDRLVMVFTDARTIDEVIAFTPEEL